MVSLHCKIRRRLKSRAQHSFVSTAYSSCSSLFFNGCWQWRQALHLFSSPQIYSLKLEKVIIYEGMYYLANILNSFTQHSDVPISWEMGGVEQVMLVLNISTSGMAFIHSIW